MNITKILYWAVAARERNRRWAACVYRGRYGVRGIGTLYLLTDRNGFCGRYGWRFLCEVTGDGEARLSGMYILLSGQNAQSTQKQKRFCTITQKSRRIPEPGSKNWGVDGIWFPHACGNVIKCWFHMAFYSHFSKKVLTNLQKWFIIDT